MANVSAQSITAVALIFIGLIACILALAVDRWAQFEVTYSGDTSHYGLVDACVCSAGSPCVCIKYEQSWGSLSDYLKACLAAVCLAFLGNLCALVIMIMWILNVGSDSLLKILKAVILVSLGVAVFWNLIAVIVFGAMDKDKWESEAEKSGVTLDYSLGWAWGMAILAAILELAGLVVAALSPKSE